MPFSDLITAFDHNADRANPDRLFRQACWLGWCAELVYPCESEKAEEDAENEARRAYRKQRPWWRCMAKFSKDDNDAKDKWHEAAGQLNHKCESRIQDALKEFWQPKHLAFINSFGTECFVAGDDKNIIVSFRGTQPTKFRDLLSDGLSWQTKEKFSSGQIHFGFADALRLVWDKIDGNPHQRFTMTQLLDRNEPATLRDKDQKVWITGHSLGGALATLAADRLINEGSLKPDDIGGVFTFGQPRVGDGGFAAQYDNNLKGRHFRFINNNDIVTRVPPGNLMLILSLLGGLFGSKAQKDGKSKRQWKLVFRDVGDVVHIDRSDQPGLLAAGFLWWKVQLCWRRLVSRIRAPFTNKRPRTFMSCCLPGLIDHKIEEYNRALRERAKVNSKSTMVSSGGESS